MKDMFKGVNIHHRRVFVVNAIVGVCSILLALLLIAFDTISVRASGDDVVAFQGRIYNEEGELLDRNSVQMLFRLYRSSTNGQCLWSNSSSSCATGVPRTVVLTNGAFNELLGDTTRGYASMASVAEEGGEVYLGVAIEGQVARIGVNGDIYINLPVEEEDEQEEVIEEDPIEEEDTDEVIEDPIEQPSPVIPGSPVTPSVPGGVTVPAGTTSGTNSTAFAMTTTVSVGGIDLGQVLEYPAPSWIPVDVGITFTTPAKEVHVLRGGEEMALRKISDLRYEAQLLGADGEYVITAVNSTGKQVEAKMRFVPLLTGVIREMADDGSSRGASGATATLFEGNLPWVALGGQSNPVILGETGDIGWFVKDGVYTVEIRKEGYLTERLTVTANDFTVAPRMILNRDPSFTKDDEEAGDIRGALFSGSVGQALTALRESVDAFRALPGVQVASDVAIPVAVVSAVGGTTSLATSFNLLPYLQYLFTSPILFIARRRRRPFGLVYNSYTKVPVSLATIQLLQNGKIVKTTVTDEQGRFFLRANPGEYTIQIRKPTFVFPSQVVQTAVDGRLLDIYRGETLTVTEEMVFVAPNIPVDHEEAVEATSKRSVEVKRALRVGQKAVALVGMALALFGVIVSQQLVSVLVFVLQVIVFGVTVILTRPKPLKGWAVISDAQTKKPLPRAIVRLFEPTYNKLLETTVTDRYGRYAFVAGPNLYYLTASLDGYADAMVKPIDRTALKTVEALAFDLALSKQGAT